MTPKTIPTPQPLHAGAWHFALHRWCSSLVVCVSISKELESLSSHSSHSSVAHNPLSSTTFIAAYLSLLSVDCFVISPPQCKKSLNHKPHCSFCFWTDVPCDTVRDSVSPMQFHAGIVDQHNLHCFVLQIVCW